MTEILTSRVHEMLGLQIGVIRDLVAQLDTQDMERLEAEATSLEKEVAALRSMLAGLPYR